MGPADVMLALLLSLQTPGRSAHAKIFLPACDATCQATPRCQQEVLFCRPPVWSARHAQFYRYETWQEGVGRYAVISQSIVEVAAELTTSGKWQTDAKSLERLLATVVSHESDMRRDVHEGRTRGDCDYAMIGGERTVVPRTCRSHCLGQVQVKPGEKTSRGYRADDLVGLDAASTTRCLQTVADVLAGSHRACVNQMNGKLGAYPACTMGLYGGVANWRSDPRIAKRAKTYRTLGARARDPKPLGAEVLRALGRPASPPK